MSKGMFLNGTCCLLPLLAPILVIGVILYIIIYGSFAIGIILIIISIIITIRINNGKKKGKEPSTALKTTRIILLIWGIISLIPMIAYQIAYYIKNFT